MSNVKITIGGETEGPAKGLMSNLVGCAMQYGAEEAVTRFRSLSPLPKDAQELFDQTVVSVGRDRLAFADAIISAGLTFSLPNWLAVPELYWEQDDDVGNVRVVMDPSSRMDGSLPAREGKRMPIPAIIADFNLGIRTLLVSQRSGTPLDPYLFEKHTRRVNEQIEDIFINGWSGANGNEIFGLLNAPKANTFQYTGSNKAWDHASKTGVEILTDVLGMVDKLKAVNRFGPYTLCIEPNYENALLKDYVSGYPKTIRARLEELSFAGRPLNIVTCDRLPDDRTALVQMTSDVVQAVVGQTPAQLSWDMDGSGWNRQYAVLACVLPRFRDDFADQSGICLGNV